jgi:hypothetical protein
LEANRRASWRRHVDSRLDAMATAVRRGAGRESSGCVSGAGRRRGATGRRRRSTAPGGGAGEADLQRGGELQRGRRWNRPAAAKSCSGGAGGGDGGRGRRRRGEISARWAFARVRRVTARCSRRLTFGAPDSANARAPQKICSAAADTAPAGGPIPPSRAVYWRFL